MTVIKKLPKYPQVRKSFKIIQLSNSRLLLQSPLASVALEEIRTRRLLKQLVPLLNGHHSVSSIVNKLDEYDQKDIVEILKEMKHKGILIEGKEGNLESAEIKEMERYKEQLIVLSNFSNKAGRDIQIKFKNSTVAIFGLGVIGSKLVKALTHLGIGRMKGIDRKLVAKGDSYKDGWFLEIDVGKLRAKVLKEKIKKTNPDVNFDPVAKKICSKSEISGIVKNVDLAVICIDEFDPEFYDEFNLACLEVNRTWTMCRLDGFEFHIGPTVIPGETPCYKCYELRRKSNLTSFEEYIIFENYARKNKFLWESFNIIPLVDLLAFEIIKILTDFVYPVTYGKVFSFNLLSFKSHLDPVLKLPHCPHCGKSSKELPLKNVFME